LFFRWVMHRRASPETHFDNSLANNRLWRPSCFWNSLNAYKPDMLNWTSVAVATEDSGYVCLRAPNGLAHIQLVMRLKHRFVFFSIIEASNGKRICFLLVQYKCTPKYAIILLYTYLTLNSLETSYLTIFLHFFWQTDRPTDRPTRGDIEPLTPELKNV